MVVINEALVQVARALDLAKAIALIETSTWWSDRFGWHELPQWSKQIRTALLWIGHILLVIFALVLFI